MSVHVVDAYDVAIILGARLRQDGSPSAALARRVRRGVQLWHGGRARALLMTGGANSAPVAEARVMRDMAVAYGVMPDHVLTEERARNTIENALLVAPLVRQAGWRRLLVVTDSFHGPRAAYIFRRFGLAVTVDTVRPEAPGLRWRIAHLREAAALPWTMLRVEARRLLISG